MDRLIWRLAARQHGAVSRRQLLEAGGSARQVGTRLRDDRLTQLHHGVYLVGAVPGPHTHEAAALLACGQGAALSHRSAASLLAMDDVEHLVAEANYRGLASEPELRDQVERNHGRRGVGTLRQVLDVAGGPQRTRSPAERRLLRLLRRTGVEGYETNAKVMGYEVDFLWRDLAFALEVDGWDGHSGRVAFERDRLKIARLQAGGLRVMPVTGRQIRRDPTGVVERLTAALGSARRWRLPSVS